MQLTRLSPLTLSNKSLRPPTKLLRALGELPVNTSYCFVEITVPARILKDERIGQEHRRELVRMTEFSALERYAAFMCEHSVRLGWHFHVPSIGPYSALVNRTPTSPITKQAYDTLRAIVDREAADHSDMLHDIGAKGRSAIEQSRAGTAMAYALGVRIVPLAHVSAKAA